MDTRTGLLAEFMAYAPYQPATNYWRSVEVEEVIGYDLPNGQGLDLGCGDGHLMAILLSHVGQRDLVGLDIDEQETAMARERKIYREVATATADKLPFPASEFDFVFSNSVLEHIANIDGTLAEVARVLRPGGRFLFTVPGPDFHQCLKGPRFNGDRNLYLRDIDARCYHLRYWSAAEWSEHLQMAGLTLVHHREYLTQGQVQRWEWIACNTSGILYSLTGKKEHPIGIQRKLGVRKSRVLFPHFLASLSARFLSAAPRSNGSAYGCLLIEARSAQGLA